jgi:hypothetical protein
MDWRSDMENAPIGCDHPYSHCGDPATFLLVYNGHHIGVGWGRNGDEGIEWWGEDGEPIEPAPTHWMPLPEAPQ